MYKGYWLVILWLLLGVEIHADEQNSFNNAWRFHRGDIPQAKQPQYIDKHWKMVDFPHDWRLTPDSLNSITTSADTVGWYRKTFTIASADTDKNIYLCFERIHGRADIWMNGTLIHSTSCSYEPVKIDVTRYLQAPYKLNHLAIRVANTANDSILYQGAGITHDAWFIRTDHIHLDAWETQVKTKQVYTRRGNWYADLQIKTQISNTELPKGDGWLRIHIVNSHGESVHDEQRTVTLTDSTAVTTDITLRNPQSWYTATPDMYRAILYVGVDERMCDSIAIPFGISTIAYSQEMGLLHNDEQPLIQGSTLDFNGRFTGFTAFRRAEGLLVEHLQTNGYTAVRCPMGLLSEHFLNACDTLGIMVFVDAFSPILPTEEWSDIATINHIKRFRNHPSIVMWCVSDAHESALINTVDNSRPISTTDILHEHLWSDEYDAIGERKPRAYQLDAERLVNGVSMSVSALDTLRTDSTVWLPETQRWTWPGYEGDTMKVNVYSRNDRVALYLNEGFVGNVKPDASTHSATFYLPYTPGKLDAVTTISSHKLWKPKISKSKIKYTGRLNEHFRLYTEGAIKYVYLTADRPISSNANGELCFVRVDVLDADGNILPDAEIPLSLHIRGPGVIIACGNSREMSSSLHLLQTYRGSALIVIRPFAEVGTIRLTVRTEGIEIEDTTIKIIK